MAPTEDTVPAARVCADRAEWTTRGERRPDAGAIARRVSARDISMVQRRPTCPLVESRPPDGALRRRVSHRALLAQTHQAGALGDTCRYCLSGRGHRMRVDAQAGTTG